MCGRPAVPNISARPSEMVETGSDTSPPGAMMASPRGWMRTASANIASGLKPKCQQHGERHEGRAAEQQAGLDDLHPGGRLHAAEGDVDDHQRADDDDRVEVVEPEQQLDQLPRAHHLRDQVEGDHDQRAGGGQDADLRLVEPEGGDVGEGELAEVAQPLRDQEQHDRPADQEADGVDQPVEAGGEDQARRCRGSSRPTCSRRRWPARSGSR